MRAPITPTLLLVLTLFAMLRWLQYNESARKQTHTSLAVQGFQYGTWIGDHSLTGLPMFAFHHIIYPVLTPSSYLDGIPVSTTMCITGATMGVALCNGDCEATIIHSFRTILMNMPAVRSFNWGGLAYIVLGWVLTVPIVGALAGCLMAIILYAPHFV